MKPVLLVTFFLLGLMVPAFAQLEGQARTDSLLEVTRVHVNDSNGAKAWMSLTEDAYYDNPALAETYARKGKERSQAVYFADGEIAACSWLGYLFEQRGAIDSALLIYNYSLELARKVNYKKTQGILLNNIAAIYRDQGKIREALGYYAQSIALAKSVNNAGGIAATYNNIGLIYYAQGQIEEALDYYNRSLHLEDSLGRKNGIATSLHNIADVYKDQGQYDEAMEYGKRSLALSQEENDQYSVATSMVFLGTVYEAQGKTKEALDQYQQSLVIRERLDDKHGMAYSLRDIGSIYEKMDSTDKAFACYLRSVELFEGLDEKSGTASSLHRLGKLCLRTGETDKAKAYGERSLQLAKELGYPGAIRDAAELLDKVYRKKGEWENALLMSDLYVRMRDSVLNEETRKTALKDKFRYEYEKRESVLKAEQAAVVNRQTLLRNAFVIGFVLVLLLAVVLFNRYKLKLRTARELEQKNTIISKEKDRAEQLLLNILPSDIAAELKETGTATAKDYESATVMFTDFQDFTKAGEKLSPQALVNEIDYYFKAFDEIISKYRIEKVKTIGDAYMCASGIPGTYPDHAAEMVKAAIAICEFIVKAKQERIAKGLPFFEIRIGINTGPLVAGVVGSKKFTYDIWGDSVNLASRMESNSETGKINISSSTYELVKDRFGCKYRGKIEAKNKGQVDMYFVEAGVN